jgi:hypothetical protein
MTRDLSGGSLARVYELRWYKERVTNGEFYISSGEGKAHPCTLISTKRTNARGQLFLRDISLSLHLNKRNQVERGKRQRNDYTSNLKPRFEVF